LEKLRIAILNGETIDERDPKVYEGQLIDKKSREFIKLKYIRLESYDFDEIYSGIHALEHLAAETKKFLTKDNFILFQPVFIYQNKAVTRPDVLIKEKGKYTVIEVKGTTKPKAKHLVDLIYQKHVINDTLQEFHSELNDYLLCVVNYTKGTNGKVNFVLNEHIPLVKDGKDLSSKIESQQYPGSLKYSDAAIEAKRKARLDLDSDITIKSLIEQNVHDLDNKKKKTYDSSVVPLLDLNYFEKIIDELFAYQTKNEPSLIPDIKHFTTWFDNYSLLLLIRKYYFSSERYLSFHYSGNVIRMKDQFDAYVNGDDKDETSMRNYLVKQKETNARFFKDFYNTLYTSFNIGVYKTKETKELLSKLKDDKVYFDFESINPATCVVDDTTPYTQIVTQVSVIKNNGNVNNIVIDPQTIKVNNFKNIIDAIYNGDNCSYIVYNKTFECGRLREMEALIHDADYTKKIEIINRNIYDLCDFFNPHKDLITIRELGGYFSIKNLLPIIEREAPDLLEQSGAKDYHTLSGIHHGGEALNQTSRRFFNQINDEE
jgi:hypothetical protein